MAELTSHAKSLVESFNNADWDAARQLLGNSTYNELGTQRSLVGADAIIGALKGWKSAMPDAKGTVTSAGESGQQVVLEVTWEAPRPARWSLSRARSHRPESDRRRLPHSSLTTRTGS
jgi:SnoaL-like polyketide cyclase